MQIQTALLALAAASLSAVSSSPVGRNPTDTESSNDTVASDGSDDSVSALNIEGLSIVNEVMRTEILKKMAKLRLLEAELKLLQRSVSGREDQIEEENFVYAEKLAKITSSIKVEEALFLRLESSFKKLYFAASDDDSVGTCSTHSDCSQ